MYETVKMDEIITFFISLINFRWSLFVAVPVIVSRLRATAGLTRGTVSVGTRFVTPRTVKIPRVPYSIHWFVFLKEPRCVLCEVWNYSTGRFIMFRVITNICNKKTKGPTFFVIGAWSICLRYTAAYGLIVRPLSPPMIFRRSNFRRQALPHPYDARDPSSERWNCGRECWPVILPKSRLPRYI